MPAVWSKQHTNNHLTLRLLRILRTLRILRKKNQPPKNSIKQSQTSLTRLIELIDREFNYECHQYEESLKSSLSFNPSSDRLIPGCRYPVEPVDWHRNAFDHIILTVNCSVSDDIGNDEFEPGKTVRFFFKKDDGSIHEFPHQCYIDSVAPGSLGLRVVGKNAVQSILDSARAHLLGLRLGIDATSYQVMKSALQEAIRRDDDDFVQLRETLVGSLQPRFRQLPHVNCPWLNHSQADAVQHVLEARDVAIVHGPPGTGKTTTLVEAIIETLQRENQVLVTAPSNVAVDWISEQLMRRGVNVLRVGNPVRISDEMLDCSYERRYAAHPDYSELWGIRKRLRELSASPKTEANSNYLRKLRYRQTELEIKIHSEIFDEARVISCTLVGAANQVMAGRRFGTLFIDEAAQALEPACWNAILRCSKVVLCGDYQQLPPTVKCPDAARDGLVTTLMQRVAEEKPSCVNMLTVQYRMNRAIMGFSSRWFYNGRLQADPQVADRLLSPIDCPVTWLDTSACGFSEQGENFSLSRSNPHEARLLIHTLKDYIDAIGPSRIDDELTDFGIITPYKAQARLIRRLLKMNYFLKRYRRRIAVNTVDGFQGQERDVIVISMVRDNDDGTIGFLRDLRRMNVAMTRAKMKLIIIGSIDTLSRHRFYRELIEYIRDNGEVIEIPPPQQDI